MNGGTRVSYQRDATFRCREIERASSCALGMTIKGPAGRAIQKNMATAYSIVCKRRILVVLLLSLQYDSRPRHRNDTKRASRDRQCVRFVRLGHPAAMANASECGPACTASRPGNLTVSWDLLRALFVAACA